MTRPMTQESAGALRALWFDYLDAVAPVRPRLHRFCLRLTGSAWDAEDLLQDTLLRGFGAIGRGDLHGGHSAVSNVAAYLSRIAVNLWIDGQRRERPGEAEDAGAPDTPVLTRGAGAALFDRAAPQERAAIVLKDVFDFSLEEIADLLSTSVGAVKSALHRGRANLETRRDAPPRNAASPELIDRFMAAFNARDVAAVTALLLEQVTISVPGVGGERGRDAVWIAASMSHGAIHVERRRFADEWIVAHIGGGTLVTATRLEESGGLIARATSYVHCPETLAVIAAELGLAAVAADYHQPPEILARMVAGTVLPWRVIPAGG
ncbi:MAG: sigma factor-like helix-turn-helix DNA-binding protein [Rhizomicrobium sp.]